MKTIDYNLIRMNMLKKVGELKDYKQINYLDILIQSIDHKCIPNEKMRCKICDITLHYNFNVNDHLLVNNPINIIYLSFRDLFEQERLLIHENCNKKINNVVLLKFYLFYLMGRNQSVGF